MHLKWGLTFKYPILKEVAPAMSVVPNAPIPAGWYPDPAGSFQQRWWTGSSWTNDFAQYRPTLIHSAPAAEQILAQSVPQQASSPSYLAQQAAATVHATTGPQAVQQSATQTLVREPAVDPLPAFRLPDADRPPQTVVAQPNAGTATLVPVTPPPSHYSVDSQGASFSNDYLPFGSIPQVRRGARTKPERRYTAAVWLLALLPVAFVGAAYAVAVLLPLLYTGFVIAVLALVFLLTGLGLGFADRRGLYIEGHDSTTPPALALLTPLAYLIARTVIAGRETGKNAVAPLLVLLAGLAGIGAALVLVSGLLPLLTGVTALY